MMRMVRTSSMYPPGAQHRWTICCGMMIMEMPLSSRPDTSVSVTLNGVDVNVLDASDFIFASASALAA
ncbi:hypothetical protein AGR2A_Lc60084 [Agrobacterium genomosp. 2 str. CFBP 5494]|uniref:Uncharacterized protein n=1 Tax=Agrobacterium genomosp. 2 str. CFBP 5494 TaxID=1183436 RepID=A0A9W5F2H0_9HYPH|nr:hypothetical protein AGR2A_Lc60084 [Agrobacterium genomosp. 2 str. CFBP 5494]